MDKVLDNESICKLVGKLYLESEWQKQLFNDAIIALQEKVAKATKERDELLRSLSGNGKTTT